MSSTNRYEMEETARQLEESLRALEWGVGAVPVAWERRALVADQAWGVAMHLAHLAIYEERLAAPVLDDLAAGGDGGGVVPSGRDDWFSREAGTLSEQRPAEILGRLRAARERQVEAVRSFSAERFNAAATSVWGSPPQPAGWVAWKTLQHTWEHGTPVLQVALFAPR